MNLKNIRSLMIGSNIKIIESKNRTLLGLKGKVINQTKNTITIETKKGVKKIILSQVKIKNEEN
jgi:ribonuclease P protein subunit POP4